LDTNFDNLIQLALEQRLVGWSFAWLNERTEEQPLPWDYRQMVLTHMTNIQSMLDIGTGGGEFLASLAPFPPVTWATEGYLPNVPVARQRLEPLGLRVADTSGEEPDLPFKANTFDLVIDRHSGLRWSEIARVLRPGGRFITQQVGGENCMEFNRFLQDQPYYEYGQWTLAEAVRQFEQAGLTILNAQEAYPRWVFRDISAVVFYLQAISWQIHDFSVDAFRDKLYQLHQQIEQEGGFSVRQHRLLIEAVKSG
jgi:SAM-dependent methyltransferase